MQKSSIVKHKTIEGEKLTMCIYVGTGMCVCIQVCIIVTMTPNFKTERKATRRVFERQTMYVESLTLSERRTTLKC